MSLTGFLSLSLACLLGGVTLGSSYVALTTWRRGRPAPILCARCLKPHQPVCETPADREFKARLLEALERNAQLRAGPFCPPVPPAAPTPPAAPMTSTATPMGPTTGGSPRPASDVPTPPIQHNAGSARIDASSRKQFGMCDYPD